MTYHTGDYVYPADLPRRLPLGRAPHQLEDEPAVPQQQNR